MDLTVQNRYHQVGSIKVLWRELHGIAAITDLHFILFMNSMMVGTKTVKLLWTAWHWQYLHLFWMFADYYLLSPTVYLVREWKWREIFYERASCVNLHIELIYEKFSAITPLPNTFNITNLAIKHKIVAVIPSSAPECQLLAVD